MEPENLYAKRNFSPLDDLFEKNVISKRSYEDVMKTADRSFFQQLGYSDVGDIVMLVTL